jgi:SAM domain (Sterile alpha motif)
MQQVANWLEKLGLEQYAERFAENDIDLALFTKLTDADLKELGVISLGHRKRPPYSDSRFQRRHGNARIDRAADRVGIKNCRQIDEARCDRDVCDIRHPEPIRAIDGPVAGEIQEDRAVVVAVGRGYEPPTTFGL